MVKPSLRLQPHPQLSLAEGNGWSGVHFLSFGLFWANNMARHRAALELHGPQQVQVVDLAAWSAGLGSLFVRRRFTPFRGSQIRQAILPQKNERSDPVVASLRKPSPRPSQPALHTAEGLGLRQRCDESLRGLICSSSCPGVVEHPRTTGRRRLKYVRSKVGIR